MECQKSNSENRNFLYHSVRCLVRPVLDVFGHLESHGNENIPRHGGVLLVSNHVSLLDPVIIGAATARELHFLGADDYLHIPCVGRVLRQLNGIPIKRSAPSWGTLKRAVSCLKRGEALVIFPEGTRSADGVLGKMHNGASFVIHHTGVPTIPVFLKGAERFLPRGSKFIRPTQLSVIFGPPIDFTTLGKIDKKQELYQQMTEQVRTSILALRKN